MTQTLPPRGFGAAFSESFNKGLKNSLNKFLENELEAEQAERQLESRRATARALGLPEGVTEPAVMAALAKQKAQKQENEQLLRSLGILGGHEPTEVFVGEEQFPGGQEIEGVEEIPSAGKSPRLSSQQLAGLALVNPQLASMLQKNQEAERKAGVEATKEKRRQFESERSYHTGLTKNFRETMEKTEQSLPRKRHALNLARDAFETGNLSFFSPDTLADYTGLDVFRTAKGAQLLTAGKENLLGNISRVTARAANQWFEQRLNSMFPKIGQSREANETVAAMLQAELDLDEAMVKTYNELAAADRKKYGYIREDIGTRVNAALKPVEDQIMAKTSYQLRRIYEREKGPEYIERNIDKKVSKGTPLTLEAARILRQKYGDKAEEKAKKLGYTIPTAEQAQEFLS